MTHLDVYFRYGKAPGSRELRALDNAREVYGVRRISFDEKEHIIRVEYDASRLNENTVLALLRRAALEIVEKVPPPLKA